jgi:hypothetical protein
MASRCRQASATTPRSGAGVRRVPLPRHAMGRNRFSLVTLARMVMARHPPAFQAILRCQSDPASCAGALNLRRLRRPPSAHRKSDGLPAQRFRSCCTQDWEKSSARGASLAHANRQARSSKGIAGRYARPHSTLDPPLFDSATLGGGFWRQSNP